MELDNLRDLPLPELIKLAKERKEDAKKPKLPLNEHLRNVDRFARVLDVLRKKQTAAIDRLESRLDKAEQKLKARNPTEPPPETDVTDSKEVIAQKDEKIAQLEGLLASSQEVIKKAREITREAGLPEDSTLEAKYQKATTALMQVDVTLEKFIGGLPPV
jgi:hypothetical protein